MARSGYPDLAKLSLAPDRIRRRGVAGHPGRYRPVPAVLAAGTAPVEFPMELSVKVVTRPLPGIYSKIFIVIIIIVTVLVAGCAGYGPATVAPLVLVTGLAGARVARS